MTSPSKPLDDIRSVGLDFVPDGSFLITGRPRVRSAWLAALLSSEEFPCYHEAPMPKTPLICNVPFGLVDPGAACLWPNKAMKLFGTGDRRVLIIERNEKDSRRALERLTGQKAKHWEEIEAHYQFFKKESDAMVVPFESLESYGVVVNLVSFCTGGVLSRQRFELFDGLRIEQDFVKAQQREAAAA